MLQQDLLFAQVVPAHGVALFALEVLPHTERHWPTLQIQRLLVLLECVQLQVVQDVQGDLRLLDLHPVERVLHVRQLAVLQPLRSVRSVDRTRQRTLLVLLHWLTLLRIILPALILIYYTTRQATSDLLKVGLVVAHV